MEFGRSNFCRRIAGLALVVFIAGITGFAGVAAGAGPIVRPAPLALSTIPVPEPDNLYEFVKSKKWAIILGKTLFWEMQLGSDGVQACASCHYHAGLDNRIKHQLNSGSLHRASSELVNQNDANNTFLPPAFDLDNVIQWEGPGTGCDGLRGNDFDPIGLNIDIKNDYFPFDFAGVTINVGFLLDVVVACETNDAISSQGVVRKIFEAIGPNGDVDLGYEVPDLEGFRKDGVNLRRVEPRRTPTIINSIFYQRLFWDGRAMPHFNGVNPDGSVDENAFVAVLKWGRLMKEKVSINNGAAASQSVGPPVSGFEMSWDGRRFPNVGRKMRGEIR